MTFAPPATANDVARWLVVLSVAYIAARCCMALSRKARLSVDIPVIADSLLFSTSALVILGIWYHEVLVALGDLTIYLIFAGLGGVSLATRSLLLEGRDKLPQGPTDNAQSNVVSEARVAEIVRGVIEADQRGE